MEIPHRKLVEVFNTPGEAHFLTFSCFRRQPFLKSERTCGYLAEAININRKKHCFELWAYVFMPEHVHLLIWFPQEKYDASAAAKSVKQSVARRALCYLRTENPSGLSQLETGFQKPRYRFWQQGIGYDRNIWSRWSLRETFDYIHNNPVQRGLVNYPDDYHWSSLRAYGGHSDVPLHVDVESLPFV